MQLDVLQFMVGTCRQLLIQKELMGRGPVWSNSLFEDNAEFGYGMRLAVDSFKRQAIRLLEKLRDSLKAEFVEALISAKPTNQVEVEEQRNRVVKLKDILSGLENPEAKRLYHLADYLIPMSVWILGGDGWAYDIGYGGLDHVVAQKEM